MLTTWISSSTPPLWALTMLSAISVEPVSLLTPTNTITTGGIWGLLFILVIPRGAADLRLCPLDAPPETVTKGAYKNESNTEEDAGSPAGDPGGPGHPAGGGPAVKRSSAQREAEEAAAQDAASVITETEAAYSSLTYDNGNATLSFHLDEAGQVGLVRRPGVSGRLHHPVDPDPSHQPQTPADHYRGRYAGGLWPDQPFATLTAAKPDGGTLTISLGNTTTDGNSYYMLMNEQESPVYISNSLYNEMSKTIYDMCDLPELPPADGGKTSSPSPLRAPPAPCCGPSTRRPPPTRRPGRRRSPSPGLPAARDVTGNADTASLLAELGALTFTKCVDYKPTDEAAALWRL